MILPGHNNSLETNVNGPSQDFTIGEAGIIIDILRNRLYEFKIQTTVQEYLSNAKDSHVESGTKKPFEVTVPNELNPVFKVRDFGLGITPDRMSNVFLKYGSSTKRNDNKQIGGLGIGAKSAFSYTDSFTITTFVDGTKRSYVAHVGVTNQGSLDLVSTESTKEGNGTEIQIAVKRDDIREFRNGIMRAIYFWDNKPTLKGQLDTVETAKGYKLNSIEMIDSGLLPSFISSYSYEPIVIIDGIVYPVSSKLLDKCKVFFKLKDFCKKKIIFRIANGVVDVAASRESIADSPRSIEALEKLAQKATLEIKTHLNEEFAKVNSTMEYFETFKRLIKYFQVDEDFYKYGKYTISGNSLRSELFKTVKITEIHCRGRFGRGKVSKITRRELSDKTDHIPFDMIDQTFFLNKSESPVLQNKRIREYFATYTTLYLVEQGLHPITSLNQLMVDLALRDIQSLPLPVVVKAERAARIARDKQQICLHVLGGGTYEYTTLHTNTQKWFFVPISNGGWGYDLEQLKDLSTYLRNSGVRICGLADRAVKMVEGNKNFSPLKEWLDKFVPNKAEINCGRWKKAKNTPYMDGLQYVTDLKDKEVSEMIDQYKTFNKLADNAMHLPQILLDKVNKLPEIKEFIDMDENVRTILVKRYPLLEEIGSYATKKAGKEITVYMNAKYESEK